MARRHDQREHIPVEPLKAQVLMTKTGYPAHLSLVADCYGEASSPAAEPGWFWIFATPRSAANIRRRGLRTIGTVTSTFIPPQSGPPEIDESVMPDSIPVVGTQAHADAMVVERIYQLTGESIS